MLRRRFVVAVLSLLVTIGSLRLAPPISALEPPRTALADYQAETLRGFEAEAYADSHDRKGYNKRALWRGAAALEARGYEPSLGSTIVVVVKKKVEHGSARNLLEQLTQKLIPSVFAQTTYVYLEEGYARFTSWDDQDNSTWEGVAYIVHYDTGRAAAFWLQLNIDTEDPGENPEEELVWSEGELYPGDDDEEQEPLPIRGPVFDLLTSPRVLRAAARATVAADLKREDCNCNLMGQPGSALADCMIIETLKDATPWCVGAGVGCLFTGPKYWACVASGCAAAIIANWIEEMMDVWERCIPVAPNHKPAGVSARNRSAGTLCGAPGRRS